METALWVVRDRITSAAAIDDLLADSVDWNIRDLVVQIRGRADAYYTGGREPRAEALAGDGFDPLGHLVRGGAAVGVRIHAWSDIDADLCADIARRYRIEGFHFDPFDLIEQRRYPQARDAASPEDHRAVTALVADVAARLRTARPGIVLSAAVFPDPDEAAKRVLQRWPEWLAAGLIDLACAMAHDPDPARVATLLARARATAGGRRLWGGLMAYDGEPALIRTQVRAARDTGCDGVILFAYDPSRRDVIDAFASAAA
jgi:uncharacterized lipoprotein YddW (UPF0748 family)